MRTEKWEMYVSGLQSHPSRLSSLHTIENMSFIKEFVPPIEFPRMLDIGVGEGLETKILKDFGYDVTGIIRGETNKDFAAINFPDVKFVDSDMHDLPFNSDSFDAVYMNQVFEHAYAPFIFLLELYCVLRVGGRIWIGLPGFKEIDDITANKDINHINFHHPNILCRNLNEQFFNRTGFKILSDLKKDNPYFDNPFLLEKQPISFVHSDVHAVIRKRRELYG